MTIEFRALCDGTNFHDRVFQDAVREFMSAWMPSFPIGLLSLDNERWERVELNTPGEGLEVVALEGYECDCGGVYERESDALKCAQSHEGEDSFFDLVECWAIKDNDYRGAYYSFHGSAKYICADGDKLDVAYSQEDALDVAQETNRERCDERSYGFPWANNTCFLPDDRLDDQTLADAGFVVYRYLGGEGNWREDEQYRLCGIDGGGYSFEGAHFAKLYALVHERKHWKVRTSQGEDYITTDYSPALVQMCKAAEEVLNGD